MEYQIREYKPSLSDLINSATIYSKTTSSHRRTKLLSIILLVLGILSTTAHGFGWGTVFCLIVSFVLWTGVQPIFIIAMITAYFKKRKAFLFHRIAFDESELKITTDKSEQRRSWDFYDQIIESKNLFLLVFGKGLYYMIPKHAFVSEGSINIFRDLARNHIKRYMAVKRSSFGL